MDSKSYKTSHDFLHLEGYRLNLSKFKKSLPKSDNLLSALAAASHQEKQYSEESQFYQTKQPAIHEEGELRVDEIKSLTSYNEMIVYLLDNLSRVPNFFNVPLLEESQLASYASIQEENTSIGTYANLIHEAGAQGVNKETLDSGFDIFEAQKFALLQIIIKGEDTHGGNIMIQVNQQNQLIPIPIDFGRCLGDNPNDEHMLPRTTRWEQWPALLYPVDPAIREYILSIEIEEYVGRIKDEFFKLFKSLLSDDLVKIFESKFHHLEANLIMVQESLKMGLTIKQILALVIPIIDGDSFHFVTQGVLQGGELWPARNRFSTLKTSFLNAWNKSHSDDSFNKEVFLNCIKNEIVEIKNLPDDILEKRYFQEMSFELRRGLYL